jgi:AcrR family transcriptional regulator
MSLNKVTGWLGSWLEQALLRRAPQDDGLSYGALVAALFAYLCTDLLQGIGSAAGRAAFTITLTEMLVMAAFTWTVLQFAGKAARLVQTLTALAGTGAVLGVASLPLVLQTARAHQAGTLPAALVMGWLVLLAWGIAVEAHIFRHALATRYGIGLMVAGLHTVLAIGLLNMIFPQVMGN